MNGYGPAVAQTYVNFPQPQAPLTTLPDSGLGSSDTSSSIGSALLGLSMLSTPILVGYGSYKRGKGVGTTAAYMLGTGIIMIPATLLLLFIPGGILIPPIVAGMYAFKND